MRNRGEVYFYVIDDRSGRDYGTLQEAVADFQNPLTDSAEKIIVRAEVIRKKVLVSSEVEQS